jgi:hypothetical protein
LPAPLGARKNTSTSQGDGDIQGVYEGPKVKHKFKKIKIKYMKPVQNLNYSSRF